MAVEPARYRFTRSDYHRMAEAGIPHEDDRVELIEGHVIRLSSSGRKHRGGVDRIAHLVGIAIVLASEESRFATGAHFFVDGGLSMH